VNPKVIQWVIQVINPNWNVWVLFGNSNSNRTTSEEWFSILTTICKVWEMLKEFLGGL